MGADEKAGRGEEKGQGGQKQEGLSGGGEARRHKLGGGGGFDVASALVGVVLQGKLAETLLKSTGIRTRARGSEAKREQSRFVGTLH